MTLSQTSVHSHASSPKLSPSHIPPTELQALTDDPNFDPAAVGPKNESPYAEVRSAVANTDDPTMPVSTLRAWVIGLFWTIVVSGANQFFHFRYPAVGISLVRFQLFFSVISVPSVAKSSRLCKIKFVPTLLSLLMGNLWARYVPKVSLFGISLNPGPFTIKEHVMIAVMSDVGDGAAYAVSIAPLS